MRPIYYKHIPNGDCFKFTFAENIEMKHIDAWLDVVRAKDNVFIDESEFETVSVWNVFVVNRFHFILCF